MTGQTYSEIAAAVRVCIKTVKNIVTKCINTGLYEPGKPPGKEQHVCNLDTMQFIEYLKFGRPSITANEIRQDLINTNAIGIPAESTIIRVLRDRLGYTYKKVTAIPRESERDDIRLKLVNFMEIMSATDLAKLHFLDESSVVRTSGNRIYGHSARGKQAYEVQRYVSDTTLTVNLMHLEYFAWL